MKEFCVQAGDDVELRELRARLTDMEDILKVVAGKHADIKLEIANKEKKLGGVK